MAILDLTSGGSLTYVLGPDHPAVVEAAGAGPDPAATAALTARLEELTRMRVVAFCSSAEEARKKALALARERTGREGVIGCRGTPVQPGTRLISHGDPLQARRAFSQDQPAAFAVEIIQASAGACVPPPKYLSRLREACDDSGVQLVVDETRTGFGRVGTFLAFQRERMKPDLVVLSLQLAPGVDGGVVLAQPDGGPGSSSDKPDDIAGSDAVPAAAVALAVLDVLDRDKLLGNVKALGKVLQKLVIDIIETRRTWAMDTRGRGLLRSLTLWDDPQIVLRAARERGLALGPTGNAAVLFAPPLTASEADLRETLALFDAVLADIES